MVDTPNEEEERLSVPDEHIHHSRLESFIDHYGVEELHISSSDHMKQYLKKRCASLSFWCCVNAFLEKIPLIRCLKEYNLRKNLFGDIIAGITVAIMHIPQGKQR
jgi:solute carrier family 26 protein